MKIKVKGNVRHRFWGEYSAHIAIKFNTEEDLDLALPKLQLREHGEFWNAGGGVSKSEGWTKLKDFQNNKYATIQIGGDHLEKLKELLTSYGGDMNKAFSVAKSIDYGEEFEFEVEVDDPNQTFLPLNSC